MKNEHIIFKNLLKKNIIINDTDYFEFCTTEDLLRFLIKYLDKGIIAFEDGVISLTNIGKKWILNNKTTLFLTKKERSWENIPVDYKLDKQCFSIWSKLLN